MIGLGHQTQLLWEDQETHGIVRTRNIKRWSGGYIDGDFSSILTLPCHLFCQQRPVLPPCFPGDSSPVFLQLGPTHCLLSLDPILPQRPPPRFPQVSTPVLSGGHPVSPSVPSHTQALCLLPALHILLPQGSSVPTAPCLGVNILSPLGVEQPQSLSQTEPQVDCFPVKHVKDAKYMWLRQQENDYT